MKLNIATSLKEIKLRKFLQVLDVSVEEDEDFIKEMKMVSVWCDISVNDVVKIPVVELKEIISTIKEAISEISPFKPIIKIEGKEYGFIPNLEEISTREYLDLSLYLGKEFTRAMAVCYRPIKSKFRDMYTIEDYKGTDNHEIFYKANASDYVGMSLFFYNLTNELLNDFPEYLTMETEKTAEKVGVGILH